MLYILQITKLLGVRQIGPEIHNNELFKLSINREIRKYV